MFTLKIPMVSLVFLSTCWLNLVQGRTCVLDNEDKYSNPCGYCGVCKKASKSQHVGVCDDHYLAASGLFLDLEDRHSPCVLKNHCASASRERLCKDSGRSTGVCYPLFGTYRCECRPGHFGTDCASGTDANLSLVAALTSDNSLNHLAELHNVVYTPIFYYKDFATILVALRRKGFNLSVYVDNGRERLYYNGKKCKQQYTMKKFCKKLFNNPVNTKICEGSPISQMDRLGSRGCEITLNIPFPRSYDKNRTIHKYIDDTAVDNPVQGNLEIVSVGVSNILRNGERKTIFERTFQMINIHETRDIRIYCSPKVRLINCGQSMGNMPKISIYSEFVILRSVDTISADPKCKESKQFNSVWKVWKVQENHDELKEAPMSITFGSDTYSFNDQTLDYGVYKVQLTVTSHLSDSIIPEISYCYFEVIRTPIQTTILGGSMRSVFYEQSLTLEVRSSTIPDKYDTVNGIFYKWRCTDLIEKFCKPFVTSDAIRQIRGPFQNTKTYYFTVNTQSFNNLYMALEHPEKQVIKTITHDLSLGINCLKNCGGTVFKTNPQEIVMLELSTRQHISNNVTFQWKYKCLENDDNFQDVNDIQERDILRTKTLIIKRNTLRQGKRYVFRVDLVDQASSAEIMIETDKAPKKIICKVFPETGRKGETLFSVKCKSLVKDDSFPSLIYEFYDRYKHEHVGRMVGYCITGAIEHVILTRERFYVRVTNFFGTSAEGRLKVRLSSKEKGLSLSIIKSKDELKSKDKIHRIALVSAYNDLIGSRLFWLGGTQTLLHYLVNEKVDDMMGALLLKNSLYITACDKFIALVNGTALFQCSSILRIAETLNHVTHVFEKSLTRNHTNRRILTTVRIQNYILSILECSSFLLRANLITEHIKENVNVHECLKMSTYYAINSLDHVGYIVSLETPLSKTQKFELNHFALYIQEMGPYFDDSGVTTYTKTTQTWYEQIHNCYVQKVIFNQNPYWWGNGKKINTNVYSLQLKSGNKYMTKQSINVSVHFHLTIKDFQPLLIQGSVKQPDIRNKYQANDSDIVVYRIDPETHSTVFIEFVNITNKANLKCIILQDTRPDLEFMATNAIEVTRSASKLSFTLNNSGSFYYIGILPGAQVKVGVSVNYTFSLFSARCVVWKYQLWISGERCAVNSSSNMTEGLLICSCTLLTLTIGGYVYNPLTTHNPFSDVSLFLRIPENVTVIIFLILIIVIFTISLIWTKKKDRDDLNRKIVLLLEDNCADDQYGYLVAVLTGTRFGAGTTSNVGIKLFGELATSRSHVFSSSHTPILQCGADDWFFLSTNQHLGSLLKVQLWIDYAGCFPNWFCRQVIVCDLKSCETSTFIVEQWFGANMSDVRLEVVKARAAPHQVNTFRLVFVHNLILGLRELAVYVSIFFKHPRSLVSRTQRLYVALCCVSVTLLVNTLLYSLSTPVLEDNASYDITTKTFVVSLVSSLSATLVGVVPMYYFRKSYTILEKRHVSHFHHCSLYMKAVLRETKTSSVCRKFLFRFTEKYVNSCKLIPISNMYNKSDLAIQKSLNHVAWMVCTAIIVVSAYITIMSSLTYGHTKTYLWLTSVSFTFILSFFVLIPVKVFLTAVFLGLLKIRIFELTSHDIAVKRLLRSVQNYKHVEGNEQSKRSQRVYFDSYFYMYEHRYSRAKRAQYHTVRICIALYILEALILVVLAVLVMEEFETYKHFYNNAAICNELMSVEMCENVFGISVTFKTLRFFVQTYMLPKLYSTKWYNGDSKSPQNVSSSKTGRMQGTDSKRIGDPHFIQVRVKSNLCRVPEMMSNITRICFPSLSSSTVDRDDYGLSWSREDWAEMELFSESPWVFVRGSGIGVTTPSNYYLKDGGYVATLLNTQEAANEVFNNLVHTDWVDDQTRIIVLEFFTISANTEIITSSYFVAEILPSNFIKIGYLIRSKSHHFHQMTVSGRFFILFSFLFFVRTLVLTNIIGIGEIVKNFWNIFDVLFCVIYCMASTKYVYLTYIVNTDEEKAEEMAQNRNVYLEVVFQAVEDTVLYVCYTFGLASFRLIRITRINDNCLQYLNSVVETRSELVLTLFLSVSSMYIMFRMVMYHLEPPTVYDFMDILVFQSNFHYLQGQYDGLTGKLSAYVLSRLSALTMFSLTISLVNHQKQITLRRLSLIKTL